jgi:hypothetical protein
MFEINSVLTLKVNEFTLRSGDLETSKLNNNVYGKTLSKLM